MLLSAERLKGGGKSTARRLRYFSGTKFSDAELMQ